VGGSAVGGAARPVRGSAREAVPSASRVEEGVGKNAQERGCGSFWITKVDALIHDVVFFCHVNNHADATLRCARKLDAVIHGVKTCNLDVMLHGVHPLVPNLDLSRLGVQMYFFLKKS